MYDIIIYALRHAGKLKRGVRGVRTLLDQSEHDILMSAQLIQKRD